MTLSDWQERQPTAWRLLKVALQKRAFFGAYLFVGAETETRAKAMQALAQTILCLEPCEAYACDHCESCRRFARASHPDFLVLKSEGDAPIAIDSVRDILKRSILTPVLSPHKIVLLEDAERLHAASANALLKTLEEPGPTTVFLLGASQPKALLPTIRSRTQVLRLHQESTAPLAGTAKDYVTALCNLADKVGLEGQSESVAKALLTWLQNREDPTSDALQEIGGSENEWALTQLGLELWLRELCVRRNGLNSPYHGFADHLLNVSWTSQQTRRLLDGFYAAHQYRMYRPQLALQLQALAV